MISDSFHGEMVQDGDHCLNRTSQERDCDRRVNPPDGCRSNADESYQQAPEDKYARGVVDFRQEEQ